jgi:hypothetical protein
MKAMVESGGAFINQKQEIGLKMLILASCFGRAQSNFPITTYSSSR